MGHVYQDLKHLSERYITLLGLFRDLHAAARPWLTGGKIPGVEVSDLNDNGRSFDVALAGTIARFTFSMTQAESTRGQVTCLCVDSFNPEITSPPVGNFVFDGQGVVTGQQDDQGGPMHVVNDAHACLLIATLLHKAITDPLPPNGTT
jgi:hypothetical protein